MTWFFVDDELAFHPKVIKAGNPAIGAWTRLGSWSRKHGTDGVVPAEIVKAVATTPQLKRLLVAGLLEEHEGGYRFHDWDDIHAQRESHVDTLSDATGDEPVRQLMEAAR